MRYDDQIVPAVPDLECRFNRSYICDYRNNLLRSFHKSSDLGQENQPTNQLTIIFEIALVDPLIVR
jgi:hypothetical protein